MAVTLNFNSCSFNKFIKTSPRWRSHMWKRPLLPMTNWRLTNSPSPSYPLPSQVSTHPLDVDASKNSYTLVKVCFVKSLTKASLSLYYQTTKIHKNILKNYFFLLETIVNIAWSRSERSRIRLLLNRRRRAWYKESKLLLDVFLLGILTQVKKALQSLFI